MKMLENLVNYENPDVIFLGGNIFYDNGMVQCY